MIWLVTFKYWETVRQLTYFIELSLNVQEKANEKSNLESSKFSGINERRIEVQERLIYRHRKYTAFKWITLAAVIGSIIIRSVC